MLQYGTRQSLAFNEWPKVERDRLIRFVRLLIQWDEDAARRAYEPSARNNRGEESKQHQGGGDVRQSVVKGAGA